MGIGDEAKKEGWRKELYGAYAWMEQSGRGRGGGGEEGREGGREGEGSVEGG